MNPSWRQLNVPFEDDGTVERDLVTRLGPAVTQLDNQGLIDAWFFMRKHPCLRLRLLPTQESVASDALDVLHEHCPEATPVLYESEVHAFGGDAGMALAHTLFHQDSRHLLTYLGDGPAAVGRRELAILLCSRLFRAAGQDWYEQGDIWARIAANRRPAHELAPETVSSLQPGVRRLMTVDTAEMARDPSSGLGFAAGWFAAVDNAGQQLVRLAREGVLERGLRAVLAHHVLFTFNRMGLTSGAQTLLAHTASSVVFD